jgi:hypothetical protein
MQTQEKVVIDDRAWIGWNMMPVTDRARVLNALEGLAGQPAEKWPSAVKRWWPDRDVFTYPIVIEGDEVLVFFYPQNGQIHLDSMTLKEALERYSAGKP